MSSPIGVCLDLAFNFFSRDHSMSMKIRDCIEYIAFVSFVNNGTSGITEIHRIIMKDVDMYRLTFIQKYQENFYLFISKEFSHVYNKMVGSNVPSRYQVSNCDTDFSQLTEKLFDIINGAFYSSEKEWIRWTEDEMIHGVNKVLHELQEKDPSTKKKVINGAGPLSSQLFIQYCALLGIIPLYCATYAEVRVTTTGIGKRKSSSTKTTKMKKELGPCALIKKSFPDRSFSREEISSKFEETYLEFRNVWGPLLTRNMMENMFCELHRSFVATCKKNSDLNENETCLDIIQDRSYYEPSKAKDFYFEDEARKCPQKFFCIGLTGSFASPLRPMLKMKYWKPSSRDTRRDSFRKEYVNVSLTTWESRSRHKDLVYWGDVPLQRTLDTELCFDTQAKKETIPSAFSFEED